MEVYGSFCTVYFLVDLKTIGCNFRIEENGTKIDFGVCLLWRSKTSENSYLIHCMVTRRFGVSCFPFIFQKIIWVTFRQDDVSFYFPFEIPDFRGQGDGGRRRAPNLEAPLYDILYYYFSYCRK